MADLRASPRCGEKRIHAQGLFVEMGKTSSGGGETSGASGTGEVPSIQSHGNEQ